MVLGLKTYFKRFFKRCGSVFIILARYPRYYVYMGIILLIISMFLISGCSSKMPPKLPTGNAALLGKAGYSVIKNQRDEVFNFIEPLKEELDNINKIIKESRISNLNLTTSLYETIQQEIDKTIGTNLTICISSKELLSLDQPLECPCDKQLTYIIYNGTVHPYRDYCLDENTLHSYLCFGNQLIEKDIKCSNKCIDGMMVCENRCYEYHEHNASGVFVIIDGKTKKFNDTCLDNFLIHFYCEDDGTIGLEVKECPSECINNECVLPVECEDTDGGNNVYDFGIVECNNGQEFSDRCLSNLKLLEFYIANGTVVNETFECEYKCDAGACIKKLTLTTTPNMTNMTRYNVTKKTSYTSYVCEDTDHGLDFMTAGVVTFGENEFRDQCIGDKLLEYYCNNTKVDVVEHLCDKCVDGRCIELKPFTFHFSSGWNMFSLPCEPEISDVNALFSGISLDAPIYTYDAIREEYITITNLEHGRGYWIYLNNATDLTIYCKPIKESYIDLFTGWNMIGGTWSTVKSPKLLYWWDPEKQEYVTTDEMVPGRSYFIAIFVPTKARIRDNLMSLT